MLFRFSRLDETVETRRPWRGFSLPGVHAGAFLRFMGIILQYLSRCASRSFGSTSAGANSRAPVAFPQNTKYITNKFPIILSLILYLPTAYQTPAPHTAERIHPPPFQPQRKGVSRRSDCLQQRRSFVSA